MDNANLVPTHRCFLTENASPALLTQTMSTVTVYVLKDFTWSTGYALHAGWTKFTMGINVYVLMGLRKTQQTNVLEMRFQHVGLTNFGTQRLIRVFVTMDLCGLQADVSL